MKKEKLFNQNKINNIISIDGIEQRIISQINPYIFETNNSKSDHASF